MGWRGTGVVSPIGLYLVLTAGAAFAAQGGFERRLVAKIHLGSVICGGDMALSADGTKAWICGSYSNTIFCFDTVHARMLTAFSGTHSPMAVCLHPKSRRLYVAGETRSDRNRGATIRVLDAATGKLVKSIVANDWRLYRIAGAALSLDARHLWLSSYPTDSNRWGHIPAALFRVDLVKGKLEQLAGLPPNTGAPMSRFGAIRPTYRLAMAPGGELLVTSIAKNSLSISDVGGKLPGKHVNVGFLPWQLGVVGPRRAVVVGDGKLAIVDIQGRRVIRTEQFKGSPCAVCADGRQRLVYLATRTSCKILVFDTLTGKFGTPLDLSAKVDESVKKTYLPDIRKLLWADKPERLVGLAAGGYMPFVFTLKDGVLHADRIRHPRDLRISPDGARAVVSYGSGHLGVVDLKTDRLAGTIRTGGWLIAVAFTDKDTVVAADQTGKCLVMVDIAKGTVTGRIPLSRPPQRYFAAKPGKGIGVYFGNGRPIQAFVDVAKRKVHNVQRFPEDLPEDLPEGWGDAPQITARRPTQSKKTGASIGMSRYEYHLVLTDGRFLRCKPPRWIKEVKAITIGPDGRYGYILCKTIVDWLLLKVRLTAPAKAPRKR